MWGLACELGMLSVASSTTKGSFFKDLRTEMERKEKEEFNIWKQHLLTCLLRVRDV